MKLVRVTYSRVNGQDAPAAAVLRPIDDGVEEFLVAHATKLTDLAARADTPPAQFFEAAAQPHFEALATGDDAAFLAAASALTARVDGRMDGRASPGLLVCATFEGTKKKRHAAVLKLSVVAAQSAVLERLESGEDQLSAVTDVLERPGDLQKGVVTPDARPGSDAILGDKLGTASLYFPEALGLRQEAKGAQAITALLQAIQAHDPAAAESAADLLPQVQSTTVKGVLAELGQQIPALTEDIQGLVEERLQEDRRPVRSIDPQKPVSGIITAGTLKITGPFATVRSVEWAREPTSDDWVISIRVDAPPERKFK